jgi:hypothetical protein
MRTLAVSHRRAVPFTGRRHYLDAFAWQIGGQSTPAGMVPTGWCTVGGLVYQ